MSVAEVMCGLVGIDSKKFSNIENYILEAGLVSQVYEELRALFREKYKDYFQLMKFTIEMESSMLDKNLISNLVKDILITEEYSLEGIAYYTNSCVEVIADIASGRKIDPSFPLSNKIIELHKTVRPNLYREIMKKITDAYLVNNG